MKRNACSLFALVLIATVTVCSCSNKNNENNSSTDATAADSSSTATQVSSSDKDFVAKAASGGMMEVELGKIAQQNARSQRVKDFGAMMDRDHSKANDELKSVAQSKGIEIPPSMNDHHRSMVEDMKKKNGNEFDKAYIDMMVNDHNNDIDAFKTQSNSGNDGDLKAFAAKTLPVLETHLDSAKAVQKSLK
jgi:putative membrane protein